MVLFVIVSVIVIVSVSVECRVDRVHIDIYIYRAFFTMVALLGTFKQHVHNIYNRYIADTIYMIWTICVIFLSHCSINMYIQLLIRITIFFIFYN